MTREEKINQRINDILSSIKPVAFKCEFCGKYIEGKIPFDAHKADHLWKTIQTVKSGKVKFPKVPVKPKAPIKAAEELKRLLKSKANQ